MKDYGITTRLRLAHFLAQISAEVGNGDFTKIEDYNYSYKNIKAKYHKLFPDSLSILPYVNCTCLFDSIYSRSDGNGIASTHDGSRFRGHGAIQLTHRNTYKRFTQYCQSSLSDYTYNFENNPEIISSNMKYSILSALWRSEERR